MAADKRRAQCTPLEGLARMWGKGGVGQTVLRVGTRKDFDLGESLMHRVVQTDKSSGREPDFESWASQ